MVILQLLCSYLVRFAQQREHASWHIVSHSAIHASDHDQAAVIGSFLADISIAWRTGIYCLVLRYLLLGAQVSVAWRTSIYWLADSLAGIYMIYTTNQSDYWIMTCYTLTYIIYISCTSFLCLLPGLETCMLTKILSMPIKPWIKA